MTPDTLLLRPLPGKLEWCCPNEAQPPVIVEQAAYLQPNALADLPDAGNACLFLSPDYFCFRRVELPTENYKISEHTLGWLVEDAVVGDTDSLHWTVLAREENTLHLAGIARTTLNDLLTTFRTAGVTLTYIVPDGFWLPYVTDSWSLLKQDERWLIRYDAWKTGVLSEALLTHLLASHTEQKIISASPLPVPHAHVEYLDWQPPLACACNGDNIQDINVLHGSFRPLPPTQPTPRLLKYAAIATFALAIALFSGLKGVMLWQLHQQKQALSAEGATLWNRYFPGDNRNSNFKYFFESSARDRYPDVLTLLTQLQTRLSTLPGLTIREVNYRLEQRLFTLTLNVRDPEHLRRFMVQTNDEFILTQPPEGTTGSVRLTLKERK